MVCEVRIYIENMKLKKKSNGQRKFYENITELKGVMEAEEEPVKKQGLYTEQRKKDVSEGLKGYWQQVKTRALKNNVKIKNSYF